MVGYVRVSTEEQSASGLGLKAQRSAIKSEAERRGWVLVDIYEDRAASGKSLKGRPALTEALAQIERGEAEGLVVAKLDRLSRSLLDFAALMETSRKRGWSMVALDLGIDTTTPNGELLANVMSSFAQFERRLIGQRTKDALAVKRAEGVRLGRPVAVSDDVTQTMAVMRSRGLSLRAIAEELNASDVPTVGGGKKWHASTVQAVLRRS